MITYYFIICHLFTHIRPLVVANKKGRQTNLDISKSWQLVVASSGKAHFSISPGDKLSV